MTDLATPRHAVCGADIESSIFWVEPAELEPEDLYLMTLRENPRFFAGVDERGLETVFRSLTAGLQGMCEGKADAFTLGSLITESVTWARGKEPIRVDLFTALWTFANRSVFGALAQIGYQALCREYYGRIVPACVEAWLESDRAPGAASKEAVERRATALLAECFAWLRERLPLEGFAKSYEHRLETGADLESAYVEARAGLITSGAREVLSIRDRPGPGWAARRAS